MELIGCPFEWAVRRKQGAEFERLTKSARGEKERRQTQNGHTFIGDPPIEVICQVSTIVYIVLSGDLDRERKQPIRELHFMNLLCKSFHPQYLKLPFSNYLGT